MVEKGVAKIIEFPNHSKRQCLVELKIDGGPTDISGGKEAAIFFVFQLIIAQTGSKSKLRGDLKAVKSFKVKTIANLRIATVIPEGFSYSCKKTNSNCFRWAILFNGRSEISIID